MKWYLAGPICHVADDSDEVWRNEAKKHIDYIDPFEEEAALSEKVGVPLLKEHFNALRKTGQIDQVRKEMQYVLELDEGSVTEADGVLAYSPFPSWGTIREVAIAYGQGKPVVLWTERTGEALSNTEIALSDVICHTFEEAMEACKKIGG